MSTPGGTVPATMNCSRCGAPNFRFACERCSLLTPAAAMAAADIFETLKGHRVHGAKVGDALKRRGFAPEDVGAILIALRLASRRGWSFPLWDRLRVTWYQWRRHMAEKGKE